MTLYKIERIVFGFSSIAIRLAEGTSSCSRPKRFASTAVISILTPVALPPGLAKLSTRPSLIGSTPLINTSGIVFVTALTASAVTGPPTAAITATLRVTNTKSH